jgi:hypothetical protein
MKVKLLRNGKEIKIKKLCPVCNSKKFKLLEEPLLLDSYFVTHACLKCKYTLGFKA